MDRLDHPTSLNPAFGKIMEPAKGHGSMEIEVFFDAGINRESSKMVPCEYTWVEDREGYADVEAHFPGGYSYMSREEAVEYVRYNVSDEIGKPVGKVTLL